jgi:hypothetical protein
MSIKKDAIKEEIRLEKDKMALELERQKQEALGVVLPNHVENNTLVQQRVLTLFELIPYSVVLDELQLEANDSKMQVTLLEDDTYIKEMQPKLLQQYKFSSIQFEELQGSSALKATISNNELLPQTLTKQENIPVYNNNGFLDKAAAETMLASVLGENTVFVLKSDFQSEVRTQNYEVIVTYKEPKEFFALIERLNKEKYSMNIAYPIVMKKIDNMIHASFILQFNQKN